MFMYKLISSLMVVGILSAGAQSTRPTGTSLERGPKGIVSALYKTFPEKMYDEKPEVLEAEIVKYVKKYADSCPQQKLKVNNLVSFKKAVEAKTLVDNLKGTERECTADELQSKQDCLLSDEVKLLIGLYATHPQSIAYLGKAHKLNPKESKEFVSFLVEQSTLSDQELEAISDTRKGRARNKSLDSKESHD